MKSFHIKIFLLSICCALFFSACKKGEDTLVHVDQEEFNSEERNIIGDYLQNIVNNLGSPITVIPPNSNNEISATYDYLNTILYSLVNTDVVVHREDLAWSVSIIEDDSSLNSFITPGGGIYITTGLLKFIKTEHELINIIGHEMMYADGDILLERLKSEYGGDILGDIILGNDPPEAMEMAANLQNIKYSEAEVLMADNYAIDMICDFLYDPHGMVDFLDRISDTEDPISWLENRPSSDDRVTFIQQTAAGCGPGSTHEDRYQYFLNKLP